MEWLRANDGEARAIAERAKDFVRTRLTLARVHCYWARLLARYGALQDFAPRVSAEAVAIANVAAAFWEDEEVVEGGEGEARFGYGQSVS